MRLFSVYLLMGAIFFSCEKEEIPINQHLAGEIITNQIQMESDYRNQIFYNLENNSNASENIKTSWDLSFHFTEDNKYILLNSANYMKAVVRSAPFDSVFDVTNLDWQFDNPNGIQYGTVIPKIELSSDIYIIDRGYSLNGGSRGYRKFKIESVSSDIVTIRYSNLDNSNEGISQIINNNDYVLQSFSFDDKSWDLLFSQYTHFFNDSLNPTYLVTGVLTNYLNGVSVAVDTINNFLDINLSLVESYNFSQKQDVIGYNWKYYNFEDNLYSIYDDISYIVRNVDGLYYKLHFIDFYDQNGIKGFPKFEVQAL